MEARVAILESDVRHIQSDVTEIKSDVKELRKEINSIRVTDFRIFYGSLIGVALGLAGLMAHGFHWL